MTTTLTVRDETTGGDVTNEFTLDFLHEHVTVRELIRSRVFQQVKDHNARTGDVFRGLVQPTDAEETLNGFKLKTPRMIDWEPQYEKAIEAFAASQVLVIVNGHQATSLDEEIVVTAGTTVTFLRLVPLVGG